MNPFEPSTRPPYDPNDWYWIVADDESRAWSSALAGWVAEYPNDRLTRIASEVELYDVLARRKLAARGPSRAFSSAEIRAALLRIDATATGDASDPDALRAVAEKIDVILPPAIGV